MRSIVLASLLCLLIILPFLLWGEAAETWVDRFLSSESSLWILGTAIFLLLAGDIVLPIPSSVVATASGAFLGIGLGTIVSAGGMTAGVIAGLLIGLGGKTIYHLGDTALFSDLKLVAHRGNAIDVALVPIGGHYTMDRFDAVSAVQLIDPQQVIPCHYNTFPPIEADAEAFKKDVQDAGFSQVTVLEPGGSHTVR